MIHYLNSEERRKILREVDASWMKEHFFDFHVKFAGEDGQEIVEHELIKLGEDNVYGSLVGYKVLNCGALARTYMNIDVRQTMTRFQLGNVAHCTTHCLCHEYSQKKNKLFKKWLSLYPNKSDQFKHIDTYTTARVIRDTLEIPHKYMKEMEQNYRDHDVGAVISKKVQDMIDNIPIEKYKKLADIFSLKRLMDTDSQNKYEDKVAKRREKRIEKDQKMNNEGKIMNPQTGRYVSRDGKLGRMILASY